MSRNNLPAVESNHDNGAAVCQPEQHILSPSRLRAIERPAFEVVVAIEMHNPERLLAAYEALAAIFVAEIEDAKARRASRRAPVMPPLVGAKMVLDGLKNVKPGRRRR